MTWELATLIVIMLLGRWSISPMAAQHGLLVRDREAFERARKARVVAFDKTGTLT
jgi:cation transport ATPase